jgi:hypothetical protein
MIIKEVNCYECGEVIIITKQETADLIELGVDILCPLCEEIYGEGRG